MRWLWRQRRRVAREIHPDEIFIDSSNLPEFDRDQFEGRIERPLSRRSFAAAGALLALALAVLLARAGELQLARGAAYAAQARENQLAERIIFADRGVIVDRRGERLAWGDRASTQDDFAARVYTSYRGIAHAIGYAKAPGKDAAGFYFSDSHQGVDGAEAVFDALLAGQSGLRLTETNARGEVVSEAVVRPPAPGQELHLSLDAKVNQALYDVIAARATAARYQGGAGIVMDIHTGELLALTSYPEYSPAALAAGDAEALAGAVADKRQPFLNRATDGLYSPGSIVKPIVAVAALEEGIIDEHKQIYSAGQITIPNPYNPKEPSVFRDWKAHGWVDMRRAIAVSSDVYFYEVGGGFEGQPGLGIERIDNYLRLFGFGSDAGLAGFSEALGTIPTPEWKEEHFPGDPWRVGNTYHTAIGQYGLTITPLQAVRAAAALGNGGTLITPSLLSYTDPTLGAPGTPRGVNLGLSAHAVAVAQEGMRLSVTEGIASGINFAFVRPAAKTGTAEVGVRNEYQNAWILGYWPYEKPRFAFAVVLERGPEGTTVGGVGVMADFLYWLRDNAPEYLSARLTEAPEERAGQAGLQ